jgi:hypothetical protein
MSELEIVETADPLTMFRQQVKDESQNRARGMSDAAKEKLRAINEHDRLCNDADSRLSKEFNGRTWTVEQLMDLFAKSLGGPGRSPRRRAIKAAYRINQDLKIYHIHDVKFFGELLPDETEDKMSMAKFLARYPLPESEMVTPANPESVPEKPARRCALGRKCLRAKGIRASEVRGRGQYCSNSCRGRARIIAKSASGVLNMTPSAHTSESRPLEAA